MNEEPNKLFEESRHNSFAITDEFSELSITAIQEATSFILIYIDAISSRVENKKTYQIQSYNKLISVASFDTTLYKVNLEKCTIEISNPLGFYGARYWINFLKNGKWKKHWTDEQKIKNNSPNKEVLFDIFSKNYNSVIYRYGLVKQKKINDEILTRDDLSFDDINGFDDINDEVFTNPELLSIDQKEELIYKVFDKMFPI